MTFKMFLAWLLIRLKGSYIDHVHRSGTGSAYLYFRFKGKWYCCRVSDHAPRKSVQNKMLLGKEPRNGRVCLYQIPFVRGGNG